MRLAQKNAPIDDHQPLQCASGVIHTLLLIIFIYNGGVAFSEADTPTATVGQFLYPFVNIGATLLMLIKIFEIEEVEHDFMSLLNYFAPLINMLLGTHTFHTLPSSVLILNLLLIPIILPIKYVEWHNADFERAPKLVEELDKFTRHLKKVCLHLHKQRTEELERLAHKPPADKACYVQFLRPDTQAPRPRP